MADTSTDARQARAHDPNLFVHLADLHLAPRSTAIAKRDPGTGRLLRDLDMDAALIHAVDDVLEQDPLPSTVVIAGDVFDTWRGSIDALMCVLSQIRRLREAGIEILGIAGNHDTPTRRSNTCMYQLLADALSTDDGITLAYDTVIRKVVGNIEYVLLPHQPCMDGSFEREDIEPSGDAGKSVLVVHGVAAGDPSLQQMDEAREVPIASWIMDMPWDYVAFGHYHKPGWVPHYEGKASYCGSLENTVISGPDLCMERGPVYVDLSADGDDRRIMHPLPIRPVVSLPDVEIPGDREVTPSEVDAMVEKAISDGDTEGAIVRLKVAGIARSTYQSLPRRAFQDADPSALAIRIDWEFSAPPATEAVTVIDEETGQEVVVEVVPEGDDAADAVGANGLLPLEKEAELSLARLVAAGEVAPSRSDDVMKVLRDLLAE